MAIQIAKKMVTNEGLTFAWADETSTFVKWDDIPEAMQTRAFQHGMSQKLGDAYANSEGSVSTAKAKFDEVLKGIMEGDWNRKGGTTGGIWVEAFATAAGESLEKAMAAWNEMSDDERKAVKNHPDVKLAKAKLDVASAQAKLDGSDAPSITI